MRTWKSSSTIYEGFPLLLRLNANPAEIRNKPAFAMFFAITHRFKARKPNGLSEPDYNEGLAELDHDVLSVFDKNREGVPVLVETFGGERNYYFYVSVGTNIAGVFAALSVRYPTEELTWRKNADPAWSFLSNYKRDYFPEE